MTGLRLRQNLKLQDTDLESLSHQGFGVAMQLLKHREDAMDVVQDSLQKLVHGGQFNEKLGTHRSWFLMVVRNGSLDVLRRRKPNDVEALADQPDNNKNIVSQKALTLSTVKYEQLNILAGFTSIAVPANCIDLIDCITFLS